jgi:hypothetical protein
MPKSCLTYPSLAIPDQSPPVRAAPATARARHLLCAWLVSCMSGCYSHRAKFCSSLPCARLQLSWHQVHYGQTDGQLSGWPESSRATRVMQSKQQEPSSIPPYFLIGPLSATLAKRLG